MALATSGALPFGGAAPALAVGLPAGFAATTWVEGLVRPTAMAFAPTARSRQRGGAAILRLLWSAPGLVRVVLPAAQLEPK